MPGSNMYRLPLPGGDWQEARGDRLGAILLRSDAWHGLKLCFEPPLVPSRSSSRLDAKQDFADVLVELG